MGTLNSVRSAASKPPPGVSCMQERGLLPEWKVAKSWRLGVLVLWQHI